ncbi:hypothetical protein MSU_0607 [Mycoplasma suis str. Illinois]|uniref:Uncharacterized protein n=1 Tax=Mycoplasma suis (strain Illinois) TaxID=768700 RepID=F0QRL9_MYCSL|nr:hypothetical protein MSU_0607 [Mycoplasma suis str. Illinois]
MLSQKKTQALLPKISLKIFLKKSLNIYPPVTIPPEPIKAVPNRMPFNKKVIIFFYKPQLFSGFILSIFSWTPLDFRNIFDKLSLKI